MKTQFQYIQFIQQPGKGTTSIWSCRNIHHGDELGIVKWNGGWRQYCYYSTTPAVYSAGCLRDIAEFISRIADARAVEPTGEEDQTAKI